MEFLRTTAQRGTRFWIVVSGLLLLLVGAVDAVTGSDLSFALFYLAPITLMTWYVGRNPGLVMCVAAAIVWWLADVAGDSGASTSAALRLWNAGIRLAMFAIVCLLLPAVQSLRREQELARVDPLTGAANRRRLSEAVHLELMRSRRYGRPMTIAFIDLDGFKAVNDRSGHASGDRLLCTVVDKVNDLVRQTDLMARVGGDEFVLLLPEIDQEAAHVIMPKLQVALDAEMGQGQWPVTFSIGVLTCRGGAASAEGLIKRADRLMYDIKRNGKNAIAYSMYETAAAAPAGP